MKEMEMESHVVSKARPPLPPPLPVIAATGVHGLSMKSGFSTVPNTTMNLWDRLFDSGYVADVTIKTDYDEIVYAHASVLGMASPVMRGMLREANCRGRWKSISIRGVPRDAVRVFIRFLYSSCYEKTDMEDYVLHLLVLSHVFAVPHLKRVCEQQLEQGLLTVENVVDIFQLALLCDAPRLSLICHRMILSNFKIISSTEGWKVMKQSHPILEKELLESMIEEDKNREERSRRVNERKIYFQLYEAMEALVHICRDGCRTIGPHDKDFKENQPPCRYSACKGLELLVRHLASCKLRVPGKCMHCKRMWQLLELHSRLCADSNGCGVPLCSNFKEKVIRQSKKDEIKWKILVKKILRTKSISDAPFSWAIACTSS